MYILTNLDLPNRFLQNKTEKRPTKQYSNTSKGQENLKTLRRTLRTLQIKELAKKRFDFYLHWFKNNIIIA